MSAASPAQQSERHDNMDLEDTDGSRTVNGLIYDTVYQGAEKFAATYIGQYATGKVDRLLKLIEDTAKWSLPQNSQDKNESNTPLERPLPWIPFIAMILVLRVVRLTLSVGGLLIGNTPLAPGDVVYFIQTRRRKLRAIRIVGMRDIRRREQASGQKQDVGIISKLISLLSVVVCRPGGGREAPKNIATNNRSSIEGTSNTVHNENKAEKDLPSSKRRRAEEEDDSDHDLTLDQIIDKYGGASSDNDSDFIPPSDVLNNDDSTSPSTSSASSDDDEDENVVTVQKNYNRDGNPESDVHMTNGNNSAQNSSNNTENKNDNSNVLIKENGEHFTNDRRPVPMPKPYKQREPVPKPIQEIKQEPEDSYEDRSSNKQQLQEDPEELKKSTEQPQHQQQQSVVAFEKPKDKDILDDDSAKMDKKINGGGENPQEIDTTSEVFLTPATSTEDLFFSPVGSPDLSGTFGFQPTSILRNLDAVHLEQRGPDVPHIDENNTIKGPTTIDNAIFRPVNRQSHYTGRHNKNRFRGKRR